MGNEDAFAQEPFHFATGIDVSCRHATSVLRWGHGCDGSDISAMIFISLLPPFDTAFHSQAAGSLIYLPSWGLLKGQRQLTCLAFP